MSLHLEFDSTDYEFAHGKRPSGRGAWAFSEKRNPDVMDDSAILWTPSMTLTEAKRYAKDCLLAAGVEGSHKVYVLS